MLQADIKNNLTYVHVIHAPCPCIRETFYNSITEHFIWEICLGCIFEYLEEINIVERLWVCETNLICFVLTHFYFFKNKKNTSFSMYIYFGI